MTLGKMEAALGLGASIISGGDALANTSNQSDLSSSIVHTQQAGNRPFLNAVAQEVVETKQVTQEQISEIQKEVSTPKANFDVQGAKGFLQGSTSFIHNNVGVSAQATKTDNLQQAILTAGISFSIDEEKALSKVITGGALKVSVVESTVQGALTQFNESGEGIEFVVHLNSALKKISIAHSKHSLDLGSAGEFSITSVETNRRVDTQENENTITRTTTIDTTTNESRLQADDVSQTSLSMLIGITKDLDVILSYSEDSLGESSSSAKAQYRINNNWSLQGSYDKTKRYSGDEKQDIYTATANYNKGVVSAFIGGRYNGDDISPYAGIRFSFPLDGKKLKPTLPSSAQHSLSSPVTGIGETHQNAIRRQTRSTTQTSSDTQTTVLEAESEDETVSSSPNAPQITALGTISVNDNGGGLPTTINVSASNVRAGAIYSLTNAPTGLTINPNTGVMTYNQNVGGNQSFPGILVTVTNTDATSDSDTFTLSVTDNG